MWIWYDFLIIYKRKIEIVEHVGSLPCQQNHLENHFEMVKMYFIRFWKLRDISCPVFKFECVF
jgi:hypothetical protein